MAKKTFNLIRNVISNEVSLCSKYNSGANKQTSFEIIKDKEHQEIDLKPIVKYWLEECVPQDDAKNLTEFLNMFMEQELNNSLYNLLMNGLQEIMYHVRYDEHATKEEKEAKYILLFNEFIALYEELPITKTEDDKYIVSLSTDSHIQEQVENPQNETSDITKEKTSTMEEQKTVIAKAIELLSNAIGLTKSEAPVDETLEEKVVEKNEQPTDEPTDEQPTDEPKDEQSVEAPVEPQDEPTTDEPAEAEAPNVEDEVKDDVEPKADEQPVEAPAEPTEQPDEQQAEDEPTEEPVEDTPAEPVEAPVNEEVQKTSQENEMEELVKAKLAVEQELAELKKAKEEADLKIEKASYVQKAKDEYSMLVGTPEEIGEKLYSISKSNLDESSKEFVLEQLKKVAVQNEEMTKEVGSVTKNAGNLTDEEVVYQKAQDIANKKGISINKALREIK